jgi:hypothetical protein
MTISSPGGKASCGRSTDQGPARPPRDQLRATFKTGRHGSREPIAGGLLALRGWFTPEKPDLLVGGRGG